MGNKYSQPAVGLPETVDLLNDHGSTIEFRSRHDVKEAMSQCTGSCVEGTMKPTKKSEENPINIELTDETDSGAACAVRLDQGLFQHEVPLPSPTTGPHRHPVESSFKPQPGTKVTKHVMNVQSRLGPSMEELDTIQKASTIVGVRSGPMKKFVTPTGSVEGIKSSESSAESFPSSFPDDSDKGVLDSMEVGVSMTRHKQSEATVRTTQATTGAVPRGCDQMEIDSPSNQQCTCAVESPADVNNDDECQCRKRAATASSAGSPDSSGPNEREDEPSLLNQDKLTPVSATESRVHVSPSLVDGQWEHSNKPVTLRTGESSYSGRQENSTLKLEQEIEKCDALQSCIGKRHQQERHMTCANTSKVPQGRCHQIAERGIGRGNGESSNSIRLRCNSMNEKSQEGSSEAIRMKEVRKALDDIGSSYLCMGGVAASLPYNPGLLVEGVGRLSLPLPAQQAKALASVAASASMGQGSKSYRSKIQLDESCLQILNPNWGSSLDDLLAETTAALGVPSRGKVTCKLSHMLLQVEDCADMKQQMSNESVHGCFATLIIQLPSSFEGGSIRVSHGGDSQSLALNRNAEFKCHYAIFYSDCDVECDKIVRGCRVSLVYSLYWSDFDALRSTPSANKILAKQNKLNSLIRSIPPEKQMFLLPLKNQYGSLPLSRHGIDVLDGVDKTKASAIQKATMGTWNLAVVEACHTEMMRGHKRAGGGQEQFATESETFFTAEAFAKDGSQVSLSWMNDVINFSSTEEGGMVLADKDIIARSWSDSRGECYVAGPSRRAFYKMRFLMVYSDESVIHLFCHSKLNEALQFASTNSSSEVAEAVLSVALQRKLVLSWRLFCQFGEGLLVCSDATIRERRTLDLFNAMPTKALPSPGSTNFILSALSGCVDARYALIDIINRRVLLPSSNQYDSVLSFLRRYEVARAIEEDYGVIQADVPVCSRMLSCFVSCSPKSVVGEGCEGSTYQIYMRQVKQAILRLTSRYSWEKIGCAIDASMDTILQTPSRNIDDLCDKIGLVQAVVRIAKNQTTLNWFKVCAKLIIDEISNPGFPTDANVLLKRSSLFVHPDLESCVQVLLEFGTAEQYDRIAEWSCTAQLGDVEQLRRFCELAKTRIEKMDDEFVKRKLKKLQQEKGELCAMTQFGPPPFSWSMKPSDCGLPATIQQFLGRNEPGPMVFSHWQGIAYSRRLARCSGPGYFIQATSFACVIVKKTTGHHDLSMKLYLERMSRIQVLDDEISDLGGCNSSSANQVMHGPPLHSGKENDAKRDNTRILHSEYVAFFHPGKLGLVVQHEKSNLGFKVMRLLEDGQAIKVGKIQVGDFLTKINGRAIETLDALASDKNERREFLFSRLQCDSPVRGERTMQDEPTMASAGTKRDSTAPRSEAHHPAKKAKLGSVDMNR